MTQTRHNPSSQSEVRTEELSSLAETQTNLLTSSKRAKQAERVQGANHKVEVSNSNRSDGILKRNVNSKGTDVAVKEESVGSVKKADLGRNSGQVGLLIISL